MASSRYEKHLNHLTEKGWFATGHGPDNVVDENFAQFFSYWPHNNHLLMASISIDRLYDMLHKAKSSIAERDLDVSFLAGGVCQFGAQTFNEKNIDAEEKWAIMSALYLPQTSVGNKYFKQFYGQPLSFFNVLYPTNKRFTDFAVRPAILAPVSEILSAEDAMRYAKQIMDLDKKSGKKEHFKYLKKKRSGRL